MCHILNDPKAKLKDDETKRKIIDFVLSQNLDKSFSKFEPHHEGKGYVAAYVAKNSIKYFEIRGWNRNGSKMHKGTSTYLKFGFKTYEETDGKIEIDPNSVVLEMISIHPTT